MPTVPPIAVTTLKEARLYLSACEAWQTADQPPIEYPEGSPFDDQPAGLSSEQILRDFGGITEDQACRWALYGWPAESQLDFERMIEQLAGNQEEQRKYISFLREQLMNRYQAVKDFNNRQRPEKDNAK